MKIYRCMHDIEVMCNEHRRQLLLIWFINYLPLTKFHIVNRVWAISTLIITSCCTFHNYICNLFLNGILAGASVSYGHLFYFASSPEMKSQLTLNLVGSIWVTSRSKIAKLVQIGNSRWPPWPPSWESIFHFFSWTKRPVDSKLVRKHRGDW